LRLVGECLNGRLEQIEKNFQLDQNQPKGEGTLTQNGRQLVCFKYPNQTNNTQYARRRFAAYFDTDFQKIKRKLLLFKKRGDVCVGGEGEGEGGGGSKTSNDNSIF